MEIIRERYLTEIRKFYDSNLIKVLTGVRRCGKSIILKIITGVLSQTSGTVEVDGHISALLELGAGFNMEYTGIENVYLNGTMIGFSKEEIDAKLKDILDFSSESKAPASIKLINWTLLSLYFAIRKTKSKISLNNPPSSLSLMMAVAEAVIRPFTA